MKCVKLNFLTISSTMITTAMVSIAAILPSVANAISVAGAIETVPNVDLNRYLGRWYNIARNPTVFEYGCVCAQQTLEPMANGSIGVYNSCNIREPSGRLHEIRGEAVRVDPNSNSKFSVDFNLPAKGEYWIVALDEDYLWSVVTDSRGDMLFIMSATPEMPDELYKEALAATERQVSVNRLEITRQKGCAYPPGGKNWLTSVLLE